MPSLLLLAAAIVLYYACVGVYRLYFSPLAKFPGPRIAALTSWYCIYHDLIRGGQYTFVIEEMHRKYGPIVRTMPDVLHVNDAAFADKLYTQSPTVRRERGWSVLNLFISHTSSLATKDHDLHRRRRAAISKFFSQANVRRLTPVIDGVLANLMRRLDGFAADGRTLVFQHAMQATTKDVIQEYAFGDGRKCLDMEDFNADFFALISPKNSIHTTVHFNWVPVILNNTPPAILTYIDPHVREYILFLNDLTAHIEKIRAAKEQPERLTIFHEVINSTMPASEKATPRLLDEASVMTVAGTDTTASTMTSLAYHILADRAVFARLRAELDAAMPDPSRGPDPAALDNLPYLNALVEEALRLYPSATHRQDRTAPDEELVFTYPDGRQVLIPRGTAVGMTARMYNRLPSVFGADADQFRPERYIEDPKLMRRTMTFSRGGRQCIGINLAYQELQTFTAGIFRRYAPYDPEKKVQGGPTLELVDTTIEDVKMWGDFITPGVRPGSKGVQVRVRAE